MILCVQPKKKKEDLCFCLLLSGPLGTQGPFTSAFSRLFIAKQGIQEASSPRRVDNFILK